MEELRHSAKWKADYAGEMDKLMSSWQQQFAEDGQIRFFRHAGCDKCNQTGYKGRVGLHELLIADDGIKSSFRSAHGLLKSSPLRSRAACAP